MLDFQKFAARHGEFGAQAIVEQMERYEGIRARMGATLEERWNAVMRGQQDEQLAAA